MYDSWATIVAVDNGIVARFVPVYLFMTRIDGGYCNDFVYPIIYSYSFVHKIRIYAKVFRRGSNVYYVTGGEFVVQYTYPFRHLIP